MKTYVFMFKDTLQRFLWKNRPTVAGIFLDKARNAEAASLLDSTADMRGHGDTHRFTPGINRPPKGTDNNGTALSTRQRRHSPPLPLENDKSHPERWLTR